MISLDEARAMLLDGLAPVGTEFAGIDGCGGRILAADVIAARDQPPSAVSAMDGYAIRRAEAGQGVELDVVGEAPAGAPFAGSIGPGESVRIATGGALPAGADHIVIQEHVERNGERIRIVEWPSPAPPAYVRPAGGDFAAGDKLARRGDAVTPMRHALLAAANLGAVEVFSKPRVAILPSGDELCEPGEVLVHGQIANSASYALVDLVEAWGGAPRRLPILPDDPAACEVALHSRDLGVDVIVTIGGASVGDRDCLRPLLAKLGADIRFDRIAVQPGKPSWHARFPDGRLVLGLPGNPASALVCAHLLLKPLLHRLTGRDAHRAVAMVKAQLGEPLEANGMRETFLRAQWHVRGSGALSATALPAQDSSLVSILALANGLIRRPPGAPPAATGDMVEVLPIEGGMFNI